MKNAIYIISMLLVSLGSKPPMNQIDSSLILEDLDKNFFSLDMEFVMKMEVLKNEKVKRTYEMQVIKKDEKMRLDILRPSVERDRRVLNDGDNMWMYLPRSSKLIKIPFKQAFLGGDASNRDILRISLVADYEVIEDVENVDGEFLLRLKAKDLKTAYNQVDFYLDMKTKYPIKQEMLSLSGKVIKTIKYDEYIKFDEGYFPSKITILDQVRKDSKTIFTYTNLSKGTDKTASFFTTASLSK